MLKLIHIWSRKIHRYLVWPFSVLILLNALAILIFDNNRIPQILIAGTMILMILTGFLMHYAPKPKKASVRQFTQS